MLWYEGMTLFPDTTLQAAPVTAGHTMCHGVERGDPRALGLGDARGPDS